MASSRIGMLGNVVRDMMPPDRNGDLDGESRGDAPPKRARRPRRGPVLEKGRGRNLKIPDSVFRRLELEAFRIRTENSKLVTKILDRELPADIRVVVGDEKAPSE
jgi:hypothetical protein